MKTSRPWVCSRLVDGRRAAASAGLGLALLGACMQPAPRPDEIGTIRSERADPAGKPGDEVTVSLVGTSDLHGYVEPRRLSVKDEAGQVRTVHRGGLALFAGYLRNLRAQHPVVLLDGGDLFQGTMISNLTEGKVVIDAYNALGYTGSTIGNHEFDYGPVGARSVPGSDADDPTGALKARIAEAKFPFLAANIIDKKTGQPVDWPNTYPSRRIEVNGVPIGLIGAVTEDTPATTNVLNLRDVTIAPIGPAVKAQAELLRKQGVAAVILTVHEGANCLSFNDPRDLTVCKNADARIFETVRELQGAVDAVVAGHTHAGVAHFIGEVPILQSFAMGVAFGRADLVFRRSGGSYTLDRKSTRVFAPTELCEVALPEPRPETAPVTPPPGGGAAEGESTEPPAGANRRPVMFRCDAKLLGGTALRPAEYEGKPVVADAQVAAILEPYLAQAAAKRASLLGVTSPAKMRRNYRAESALGQLMADLIRAGAARATKQPVDIAFQNGGGLRNDLAAGPITYGDVFEVQPFDNRLALIKLPGAALAELLQRNLAGSHGVLVPSGMTVEATCSGPTLSVVLRDPQGKPLDAKRTYTVAVSDFLALGGDNFSAVLKTLPPDAVKIYDDTTLREVIVDELRTYKGRLLGAQEPEVRLKLPMGRPVKCPGSVAPPPGAAPVPAPAPAPKSP